MRHAIGVPREYGDGSERSVVFGGSGKLRAIAGTIDGDGSGRSFAGLYGSGGAQSGGDEVFQHVSAAERFQPGGRIQHGGVPVCSADGEHEELVHREAGLQPDEGWQAALVAIGLDGERKSGSGAISAGGRADERSGELQQRTDRELHGDAEEHADQQLPLRVHPGKHRNDRKHRSDVEHVPRDRSELRFDAELFERISAADQYVLGRPELDAREAQLTVWIPNIADPKPDTEHDEFFQQWLYERAMAQHVWIGGAQFDAVEPGAQRISGGGLQRSRYDLQQRGDGAVRN